MRRDRKVLPNDFRREFSRQIRVGLLRDDRNHGLRLHVSVTPNLVPEADQIVEWRELQCLMLRLLK